MDPIRTHIKDQSREIRIKKCSIGRTREYEMVLRNPNITSDAIKPIFEL
jgi:hypothetical protein